MLTLFEHYKGLEEANKELVANDIFLRVYEMTHKQCRWLQWTQNASKTLMIEQIR